MIMPRMLHKPDTAPFKEWLYAHRGLHDNATEAPENSMAAFRKAVGRRLRYRTGYSADEG